MNHEDKTTSGATFTDPHERIDPLEALIQRGLAEQLDAHVGGAAKRFMADTEPCNAPRNAPRAAPVKTASALRLWWTAPLLAAAAAVAIVAAPMFRSLTAPPSDAGDNRSAKVRRTADPSMGSSAMGPSMNPIIPPAISTDPVVDADLTPVSFEPTNVGGAVEWADRYEGMVWLDDETPARKIRRQRLETLEWTDPRDASRIQVTLPREEIVLVSSPKL